MPPVELTPELLRALHRRQEEAVARAEATSPPNRSGAGIVMVAGGALGFVNAWVALTVLREVRGSTLPVQIWHLGDDELNPTMRSLLRRFDVELVDAHTVRRRHPMRRLGPWECKAYAVLHAPFRHVLLLDADNVPLVDPATLLDLPEYAETGAIFWPDNHMHLPDSPVWRLFDVPYREELEVESGQLLVDTERCWVPLNLAVHYNAWSDLYYRYIYGDKETFHFAWRRTGRPYAMPPGRPSTVYCDWATPHGPRRMTAALEQRDFAGNAVFHHRTGAKWSLFGTNPTTGRADLDDTCHAALDHLRRQWDGRVARDPAPAASGTSHESIPGRYRLRRLGVDEHDVVLDATGAVTPVSPVAGAWRGEGHRLQLLDADGVSAVLERCRDGAWRGREQWFAQAPVELVPIGRTASGLSRSGESG